MVRPLAGLDEPENPLVGLGTEVAWKLATPSRVPCGVVGRELVGVMAEPVDRRCWTIFWQAVNRHNRKKNKNTRLTYATHSQKMAHSGLQYLR